MKLTQYDREAFVRAVMNDVPHITKEEVLPKLQAELLKAMSPEARKLFRKSPEALAWESSYHLTTDRSYVRFVVGDVENVSATIEPYAKAVEAHASIKERLQATIKGCSTLKQAKERLPEFEKYLPAESGTTGVTSLPAISNLVADLSKIGWPKEGAQ
jgi:uncharacterized protein (DUF2267 family)